MRSVLLEGETKTAKTCIGDELAAFLELNGPVVYGDAGKFFRRVTAIALDRTGVERPADLPRGESLDEVLEPILGQGMALDDTYPFGDLERSLVGKTVSTIGERPMSQDAAELWFDMVADRAEEREATLVMNARNPRARLAGWMGARGVRPTVELVLQCGPDVAALRALKGQGNDMPTPQELADARSEIVGRRALDRGRDRNPYIDLEDVIPFVPGVTSVESVVSAAATAPRAEAPYPIGFDVTAMPKTEMLDYARGIVGTAMHALVE